MEKKAIIIGAGPAGLTAALEFLENTDIKPVIYEMTADIGGIAKTVSYEGNRIDIGSHRFFSKSDKIMEWWRAVYPTQIAPSRDDLMAGVDPEKSDKVFLVRKRLSRIFYLRKFFDYPITLSMNTFLNLGLKRLIKIGASYIGSRLFPIKKERSLEDFFINRFGRELYLTFFKAYTEKVWGVPCTSIPTDWGAQRIKGLSVSGAFLHAIKKIFAKDSSLAQKGTETSLIEQFMYPKLGPGQFWEDVAKIIKRKGGEIHLNQKVIGLGLESGDIRYVKIKDQNNGQAKIKQADYFLSTMPVKDLVSALETDVPRAVKEVAEGLRYRDFMTVGMLLHKLKFKNNTKIKTRNNIIPDHWLYIQESDVRMGRAQMFNNWSPYMIKDQNKIWMGLEYFCNEGDALWNMPDEEIKALAQKELVKMGFIDAGDVLDGVVVRMAKAYPAYFGTYGRLHEIKEYVSGFKNLFLIGRNGMHRYNNMDHSMMTAIVAVENIRTGVVSKDNIWSVNTERQYHEEKNA